ncbi:hypothetical protein ACHAXS_011385 [Conticribra weissflogii]
MKPLIRKGTFIPINDVSNNRHCYQRRLAIKADEVGGNKKYRGREGSEARADAYHQQWVLLPSWTIHGIFSPKFPPGTRDAASRSDADSACRKRRRRQDHDRSSSTSLVHNDSGKSKLKRLVSSEIRQCDVCARAILWKPEMQERYFPSRNNVETNAEPEKSVAESLARFIDLHLPHEKPLPCGFCSANSKSNTCFGENKVSSASSWCGTLFCSEECKQRGENCFRKEGESIESDSQVLQNRENPSDPCESMPLLPIPKQFFCKNRFPHQSASEYGGINHQEQINDLVNEIQQCTEDMENRFLNLSKFSGQNEPAIDAFQMFGFEECALLTTMLTTCTCPQWVRNCMDQIPCDSDENKASKSLRNDGNVGNSEQKNKRKNQIHNFSHDFDSAEDNLIEEIWVMARSYWSIWISLQESRLSPATSRSSGLSGIDFFGYSQFCQWYRHIKRNCLIRVPAQTHPLASYATKTLVSMDALTEIERDAALDVLNCPWIHSGKASDENNNTENNSINTGQISLDPESTILRWRKAAHFANWVSTPSSDENEESKLIQSWLRKSYYAFSTSKFRNVSHCCAPNLVLSMTEDNKPEAPNHLNDLCWLALHDIPAGERFTVSKLDNLDDDVNSRAKALQRLMGPTFSCSCIRCENDRNSTEETWNNDYEYHRHKRLADLAMQQGRFDDAAKLYNSMLKQNPLDGDVLHARAASYLGKASSTSFGKIGHCRGFFVEAQMLWKEAGDLEGCENHPDIMLQVEKQRAYGTIKYNRGFNKGGLHPKNAYRYTSFLDGKCFITDAKTPILSPSECNFVIDSAEENAIAIWKKSHPGEHPKEGSLSGWTTSRHYAVPTTDQPVHEIDRIRPWFHKVWSERVRPLLREQLRLSPSLGRDIFIHDAFVVRYDVQRQRYLPPHFDESTHSFVIALNTDYTGGGTYVHEIGETLKATVAGGMVSFCGGELLHSGDPVVAGIRYIIVAFCYVDLVCGISNARRVHSDVLESTLGGNVQEKTRVDLFCDDHKTFGKFNSSSGSESTSHGGFTFDFQLNR